MEAIGATARRCAITRLARCCAASVDAQDPDFPPLHAATQCPALLAEWCGITVVADFAAGIIAAGGQGAPLVPAFHREVFGRAERLVAVVNIGGIANVTASHQRRPRARLDTGPGNMLLDLWCPRHFGRALRPRRCLGRKGSLMPHCSSARWPSPISRCRHREHRRDLFNADWLGRKLQDCGRLAPADVQATLVELTAAASRKACAIWTGDGAAAELLVCGGGARNAGLMAALRRELPRCPVLTTLRARLAGRSGRGVRLAWLAWQALHGRPGNLCVVTGAAGPRILVDLSGLKAGRGTQTLKPEPQPQEVLAFGF